MKVDSLSNQSFGKLYVQGTTIKDEINRLCPLDRKIARTALNEIEKFEHFDMHISKNGNIAIKDLSNPKGINKDINLKRGQLMTAINYICMQEALDEIKKQIRFISRDCILKVYNKAALSGAVSNHLSCC